VMVGALMETTPPPPPPPPPRGVLGMSLPPEAPPAPPMSVEVLVGIVQVTFSAPELLHDVGAAPPREVEVGFPCPPEPPVPPPAMLLLVGLEATPDAWATALLPLYTNQK